MNYQALKGMLEGIVKTYKCPNCSADISENNVDIVGAAGSTVNIDIECSNCQKHSMIKAEMTQINLGEVNFSKEGLIGLKNSLENLKNNLGQIQTPKIKDEEIINLSKDLKKSNLSISDLFSQE